MRRSGAAAADDRDVRPGGAVVAEGVAAVRRAGLLRPAAVDGESGYRFYDPAQLERARLIAWLRRLGMPLASIQRVCDLPAEAAAEEIADYWEQVLAETAARGQLATFLVDYLMGRGSSMEDSATMLGIRYAARSESGLVRTSNEDTAYAGPWLLAVADGVRGSAGDLASAAAVDALKPLETLAVPAEDLLGALAEAVDEADRAIGRIAVSTPTGEAATTLTALLWSAPGWRWCTSVTPGPISCVTASCSRSPMTTPTCSRWSTRAC